VTQGSLSAWEWERFAALNPPLEGENRTDWVDRLERLAAARTPPPVQNRLPYREVGEEG